MSLMYNPIYTYLLALCTVTVVFISLAMEEILAVLDNRDWFPGQMVAGVG